MFVKLHFTYPRIEPIPAVTPTASSFVQPASPEEPANEHFEALVIFDFTPTSEFELGVHGVSLCAGIDRMAERLLAM